MAIPISRSPGSTSIDESKRKSDQAKTDRSRDALLSAREDEQLDFAGKEKAQEIGRKKLEQAIREAEGFGFDTVRVQTESGETISFRMNDLHSWGFRASTQAGMEKWGNVPQPNRDALMQKGGNVAGNRQAITGVPQEGPTDLGGLAQSQGDFLATSFVNDQFTSNLFASKATAKRMQQIADQKWRLILTQIMGGDFIGAVRNITTQIGTETRNGMFAMTPGLGKALRARSNIMAMMARNAPPPPAGSESPQAQATYVRRNSQYMHRQQMYQNASTIASQGIQFYLDGMQDLKRFDQQIRDWGVGTIEAEARTQSHQANFRG